MKKIIRKVKNNLLLVIICAIMFSAIGAVAATLISSSEVSYNNANSGSSATTVKGALDELYNMAQNCASGTTGLSTAYYVYGNPYGPRATTDYNNVKDVNGEKSNVFLRYQNNTLSLCMIKDNKLECLEENNWDYERLHIMQVFNACDVSTNSVGGTFSCSSGDLSASMKFGYGIMKVNEKTSSNTTRSCAIERSSDGNFYYCKTF